MTTDPQTAADAAERVQAKLAVEGAAWLRARLRTIDEINADPDYDDDGPPTHLNAAIRLRPLPDGWMSVYGPEVDVNPDRLQALLDERDALLADRARMAAELEQVRGERAADQHPIIAELMSLTPEQAAARRCAWCSSNPSMAGLWCVCIAACGKSGCKHEVAETVATRPTDGSAEGGMA